jgi:RHS repeat-associated protein
MGLTNGLKATSGSAPSDTVISTYAYTLDGVGNRIDVDVDEPVALSYSDQTSNYHYDVGNILTDINVRSTFHYDDNGNLTSSGSLWNSTYYTYDPLNRLIEVTTHTRHYDRVEQYIYNGLGHRVGKIEDGVQTNYLIDPNGVLPQVLAEMDENNNLIAFYVYDGAGLVAKVTPASEYYFYHYDGLGSTVAITDSSAQIVNAYAYSPYGLVGAQETISNPFTYVGRFGVMAESHGLYYMRARYYDPEVGRFINKDPIGYEGGINLYGYVGGNPTHWVDPLGLFDAFILAEGDLVGIFGIEGGVGIVIDTDALGESGVFRTIGPAVGANAGAAIGGGFVKRDLEGWSYNIDANIKVVSAGAIFDDFGWAGAFGGWGPGIGVSASATHTATYSVNDFIRDIQKLWKKAKSKLNGDATCE